MIKTSGKVDKLTLTMNSVTFPQLLNFRKTHFHSDEVLFPRKNEI